MSAKAFSVDSPYSHPNSGTVLCVYISPVLYCNSAQLVIRHMWLGTTKICIVSRWSAWSWVVSWRWFAKTSTRLLQPGEEPPASNDVTATCGAPTVLKGIWFLQKYCTEPHPSWSVGKRLNTYFKSHTLGSERGAFDMPNSVVIAFACSTAPSIVQWILFESAYSIAGVTEWSRQRDQQVAQGLCLSHLMTP